MSAKEGDRIELIAMGDDPDPIAPGSKGTVTWVGEPIRWPGQPERAQIAVAWDSGRTLGLTVPPDRFRVVKVCERCGHDLGQRSGTTDTRALVCPRCRWPDPPANPEFDVDGDGNG